MKSRRYRRHSQTTRGVPSGAALFVIPGMVLAMALAGCGGGELLRQQRVAERGRRGADPAAAPGRPAAGGHPAAGGTAFRYGTGLRY
jgi:hypothetical protein